MGKVVLLDDQIANQIAAGEVVERPSSVVKELVENAIDAKARRIEIDIEEGGLELIRVRDDGEGIEPEDLPRAFERHATSKIKTGKDLFRISSLGFRGEALPSIAAVSKLVCVTRCEGEIAGRKLEIHGGEIISMSDAGTDRGTDIQVKQLFYNTPARLKYMKTVQTELSHISDYLYRLALSHPEISFTLRHNGKSLLTTSGRGDVLHVIAAIYGVSAAKQMIELTAETPDYRLTGWMSKPELTRASRSAITTIVNGRFIRNYSLVKALLNGYHTLLPVHRFPLAVFHIEMDPSLIDVNVHPSKLEVRFSKENQLFSFIENSVKQKLQEIVLIPQQKRSDRLPLKNGPIQEQLDWSVKSGMTPENGQANHPARDERTADIDKRTGRSDEQEQATYEQSTYEQSVDQSTVERANTDTYAKRQRQDIAWNVRGPEKKRSTVEMKEAVNRYIASVEFDEPDEPDEPADQGPSFPELHPIGQVRGTYIVAQNDEGLYLIDQHAAHERINYELFYRRFGDPAPVSQELLLPITLELTPSDAELLRDRMPLLEQVGLFLQPFGGNGFKVTSYPHWLPQGEEKELIDEMIEWVLSERTIDLAKLREKASILCSCKASIKANQSLSKEEIEALLKRLSVCRNPYTCPHGRPIVVSFSNYELEKMFKRVM